MQADRPDHARLELAYHALNRSHGNPFVLQLTQRGFFSEVNNLFTLMLFGIAHRRRMIVDQTHFNDLLWKDFYRTYLPDADGGPARVQQADIVDSHRSPLFANAGRWLNQLWRSRTRLEIPPLGLSGDVFATKRALTAAFCIPRRSIGRVAAQAMTRFGLKPGKFVALHVRRGDKLIPVTGYKVPEGEATTVSAYFEALRRYAGDVRDVFVLTDDAPFLEMMRGADKTFRLHSLCPAEDNGHIQANFNSQSPAKKRQDIERLLVEVEIAAVSNPFIGGFKSNVDRHIISVHTRPEVCRSIDAQAVWHPS